METRLRSAERQIRILAILCIAQMALLLLVAAMPSKSILRLRGLIIEDAQGRPRILLGAPFPEVQNRTRHDAGSAAMLFLNENGADRLLVGEGIGAQIGGKVFTKRVISGSAYGVTIMDGNGNERGGLAFTALPSGGGRGVVALDRVVGDAWGAFVDDRLKFAGMLFNYPMPFGHYQSGIEMGVLGERPFLHFKDKEDHARAEMSIAPDGRPALTVSDANGKVLKELF